jgi:hypothetical protein
LDVAPQARGRGTMEAGNGTDFLVGCRPAGRSAARRATSFGARLQPENSDGLATYGLAQDRDSAENIVAATSPDDHRRADHDQTSRLHQPDFIGEPDTCTGYCPRTPVRVYEDIRGLRPDAHPLRKSGTSRVILCEKDRPDANFGCAFLSPPELLLGKAVGGGNRSRVYPSNTRFRGRDCGRHGRGPGGRGGRGGRGKRQASGRGNRNKHSGDAPESESLHTFPSPFCAAALDVISGLPVLEHI